MWADHQNHTTGLWRPDTHFICPANTRDAPLPRALLLMSEEVRQKIEKLFDIAHMIAKPGLPFTTFPRLCAQTKIHGVCWGSTYHTIGLSLSAESDAIAGWILAGNCSVWKGKWAILTWITCYHSISNVMSNWKDLNKTISDFLKFW